MRLRSKFLLLTLLVFITFSFVVGCSKEADQSQPQNMVMARGPQWNTEEMSEKLIDLVKDKTISQDQADSVVEYLEKQAEDRQKMTEERQKNMGEGQGPPADGQRPFGGQAGQGGPPSGGQWSPSDGNDRPPGGNFRGQRGNSLSELVDQGVLTQEQADKITEVLFTPSNSNNSAGQNTGDQV